MMNNRRLVFMVFVAVAEISQAAHAQSQHQPRCDQASAAKKAASDL